MINYLSPDFVYKNGKLYIENIPFSELVERFGTPLLVFSKSRLLSNVKAFSEALSKYFENSSIHFALKSCYLAPVLQSLSRLDIGAEIMSEMEYHLASLAGWEPSKMIWNGPGKTDRELDIAIKNGIRCINIDSLSEFKRLEKICKKYGIKSVGIRIHPDEKGLGNVLIKKGGRLGIDVTSSELQILLKSISESPWVKLSGIHAHIFARNSDIKAYKIYAESLCRFLNEFMKWFNVEPVVLNVGGGLESRSLLKEKELDFDDFISVIADTIGKLNFPVEIVFEPGRCLVSDTCIALTRVISQKESAGTHWLIADIGTNILIPLENAAYQVINAVESRQSPKLMNVGDRMCYSAGVIQRDVPLYPVSEVDILAILQCGAYTYSMAEFFALPPPPVVWISETEAKLVQDALSPLQGAQMIFNGYKSYLDK